jgi:CDP-diacylglycerol--glycerol-3-phosphate 3-phosphatidyltransferase
MNAPLVLTSLRVAAIPILVIVLLSDFRGKELLSFIIFFIATLTDMLDGFWARRKKQTTVIIVAREMAVSGFRAMASSKGITIPASALGKIKMILETFTIYSLLLGEKILGPFFILSRVGLWLVILVAVLSAAEYSWRFGRAVISSRT